VRKLLTKLLCLSPVLLLMVVCNYRIDPAHLFQSGEYERGIAALLARGKNVANVSNYDERLVQKYYIETLRSPRKSIVIGSSRCLQINSSLAGSTDFFNHAVTGAALQDGMAIYQMYRERRLIPTRLILSLDPWLLNRNHGQNRWKSIEDHYLRMEQDVTRQGVKRLELSLASSREKYRQLISAAYFQESLKKIKKSSKRKGMYYPTDRLASDVPIKVADGSYSYARSFREKNSAAVRREAVEYARHHPVYSLGDFSEIDMESLNLLDAFISLLKSDHVDVTLLLPPYHPVAYWMIVNNPSYRLVTRAEACFRRLGAKHGVRILGAFDPARAGLTEEDFYDGMHPKPSGMEKILGGKL